MQVTRTPTGQVSDASTDVTRAEIAAAFEARMTAWKQKAGGERLHDEEMNMSQPNRGHVYHGVVFTAAAASTAAALDVSSQKPLTPTRTQLQKIRPQLQKSCAGHKSTTRWDLISQTLSWGVWVPRSCQVEVKAPKLPSVELEVKASSVAVDVKALLVEIDQ